MGVRTLDLSELIEKNIVIQFKILRLAKEMEIALQNKKSAATSARILRIVPNPCPSDTDNIVNLIVAEVLDEKE